MRELFEFNKSENLQLEDSEYVFKANEDLSIKFVMDLNMGDNHLQCKEIGVD